MAGKATQKSTSQRNTVPHISSNHRNILLMLLLQFSAGNFVEHTKLGKTGWFFLT